MSQVERYNSARLLWAEPRRNGYEVWFTFDDTAGVYELWASVACDDYIGCADDMADALKVARDWVEQRREGN